ncbi:MAG: asparaginase [Chlorobi bacterium]|nr:asparaginase [Chlorobiota bacterium]
MSKLLLIYAGGTIGMMRHKDGHLVPFDFNRLLSHIPELELLPHRIDTVQVEKPIDSSDVRFHHWVELARIIDRHYYDYEGFVILHGTDTMAYTASALSFMLENLSKPVVLTGSQLPIGDLRTDAKENIITSLEIAGKYENGRPLVPEVSLYFEYKLFRGNRTVKVSSEHFNAFDSPNYPPLAEAGVEIYFNRDLILPPRKDIFRIFTDLSDKLAVLKIHPGITPAYFKLIGEIPDLRAVIIETYGSGNAPRLPWLQEEIRRAVDSGIHVIGITQCMRGKVLPGRYETGRHLYEAGVIPGSDLTLEAAMTKTAYLLGKDLPHKAFRQAFMQPLRGELTALE